MIRLATSSIAANVVFPLQDLLGLGSEARMNVPGRGDGNWSWRYPAAALDERLKERFAAMTETYGRSPRFGAKR